MGTVYYAVGEYVRAERLFNQALQIKKKKFGTQHPEVALSYNNLADAYRMQGLYGEACPLYERALEIWEMSPEAHRSNIKKVLEHMLAIAKIAGDHEKVGELKRRQSVLKKSVYE
jgi:tetratricopeptide (TPR) repeat protein